MLGPRRRRHYLAIPATTTRTPNREWVEIRNTGTEPADLTGWVLEDESASHRYHFPDRVPARPIRQHDPPPIVLKEYAVDVTWTIEERRAWAFPAVEGIVDEIDLALLDPADPDDRSLLIGFEHPDFAAALEAGWDEIEFDGNVISPSLHLTIHEAVANQLWEGDPPEVGQTARRLDLAGYDRHEIFHMIGSVVSEELWAMLRDKRMADLDLMRRALAGLPGTWEADRPT